MAKYPNQEIIIKIVIYGAIIFYLFNFNLS